MSIETEPEVLYRGVEKVRFGEDPRQFLVISFAEDKNSLGDINARPRVSFAVIGEKFAVEWGPPHGPVQVYTRALDGESPPESFGSGDKPQPHYLFPMIWPNGLDWSQNAVDHYDLPGKAIRGDWQSVFDVLHEYRIHREQS